MGIPDEAVQAAVDAYLADENNGSWEAIMRAALESALPHLGLFDDSYGGWHNNGDAELMAELEDRIKELEDGLTEAIDYMEDMRGYVNPYFAEKWGHDEGIAKAKAALAAGDDRNEQSSDG